MNREVSSPGVVQERRLELDGQPSHYREAPGEHRILYVHGVPTSSAIWVPFLERTGGIAVDLPGFGRSTKRGDLPFNIPGYVDFLERFAAAIDLDDFRLCVHDWGGVALKWAAERDRKPDRVALLDAIPLLPGYRWHRVARAWRTRGVGEVAMGLSIKPVLRRRLPAAYVDTIARDFDQGTQRAILNLYRSAPEAALEQAGTRLNELTAPALIVHGELDPYIPVRFAHAYADALGGPTEVLTLQNAGHWPWCDRPDLVGTVSDFLTR